MSREGASDPLRDLSLRRDACASRRGSVVRLSGSSTGPRGAARPPVKADRRLVDTAIAGAPHPPVRSAPSPTTFPLMPIQTLRLLSPSALNEFLGCEHRTYLDLAAERGEIPAEDYKPPDAELVLERGRRHEAAFLDSLRSAGRDVVSLER